VFVLPEGSSVDKQQKLTNPGIYSRKMSIWLCFTGPVKPYDHVLERGRTDGCGGEIDRKPPCEGRERTFVASPPETIKKT